jgi:UDP-N-acetylmuramate--alanine ligase
MCGIAEVLHNLNYTISGSDLKQTEVTDYLAGLGMKINYEHNADNIKGADVIVYSSAVKKDNPELVATSAAKIPAISRAEMLAELMRMKFSIAVSGTHGKTTTTSLIGHVLNKVGFDPTVIVGGRVLGVGTNAYVGKGDYIVAEADEFDRSLLRFYPTVAVVTSIEAEHMECYADMNDLNNCFVEFAMRVPFYGSIIYCLDDPGLQQVRMRFTRPNLSYGFSRHADLYATDLDYSLKGVEFTCRSNSHELGRAFIPLLGKHNVLNALAALTAAMDLEVPFDKAAGALKSFPGVGRRLELAGQAKGIKVYDDYAHHPTEIKATLEGMRSSFDGRIVAVFQPHLYSRTQNFINEFGSAFFDSDLLVVTQIFGAREKPIEGVTSKIVAEAAHKAGHKHVEYIEDKAQIPAYLKANLKEGDVVVLFGAGDINRLSPIIIKEIEK